MTEKPEIVESSNWVILDPLSVYDFNDDDLLNLSSERREVEIIPDSAAESSIDRKKNPHNATESPHDGNPSKSVGQISAARRITRSQTPHNGAAESTVKESLKYPRAVRGKLVGKRVKRRKLVIAAAKNKSKSIQIRKVIGSKKRKLEVQALRSSSNLKTWDFYIPPNKHFHTRISSHTNCEVVKLLKSKLDDRQLQIFRETVFGYFLDLPNVVVQNQLVHSLLLRQVVPKREDELWFKVNGTKLRFGLAELGIITGLKCCGDADKGYESSSTTNRLMDMYFSGLEKVPKQSLIDCFLEKRWRSDEDAVKIAVLYFIHTFLFSTGSRAFITKADFDIVESGEYETFPWGILVFRAMVETMDNRLWTSLKMYRLGGLPLAIQCWFYECCTYVDGKWAHRIDNKVPRILSWRICRQPTLNGLSSGIFKMSGQKLKLKNVSPTEFEQIHLDLPESSGIPNDNEVDSSELPEFHPSDDDFSTPPPKRSKNQPKTKSDPPVNNLEMSDEIQRLSDGQSELKSDIRKVLKATESLKEQMMASFADVFKAIEPLSKKQPEKDDSQIDGRDGHHDRHGDGDSGGFNANDDHGSDGPDHGKDSIGDKENTEKGNVEAMDG